MDTLSSENCSAQRCRLSEWWSLWSSHWPESLADEALDCEPAHRPLHSEPVPRSMGCEPGRKPLGASRFPRHCGDLQVVSWCVEIRFGEQLPAQKRSTPTRVAMMTNEVQRVGTVWTHGLVTIVSSSKTQSGVRSPDWRAARTQRCEYEVRFRTVWMMKNHSCRITL